MRGLAVAALVLLVAAGCGSGSEEAGSPAPTAPAIDAKDRPPAPEIEGETLDGERLSLADFRGQPVFVNVWSSW